MFFLKGDPHGLKYRIISMRYVLQWSASKHGRMIVLGDLFCDLFCAEFIVGTISRELTVAETDRLIDLPLVRERVL